MIKSIPAHALYKKLLQLYPQEFREQFAESMAQTFNDSYKEKQNTNQSLFNFITWTFLETTIGILREHLLQGDTMQAILKNFGLSALFSFILSLPFIIMEIANRKIFNEGFPYMMFFILWFSLFAVIFILLPIVISKWLPKPDNANPIPAQRDTLFTNPKSSLIISVALIFTIVILSLLSSFRSPIEMGEGDIFAFGIQVPSLFIAFALTLFPIIAGYIASNPIVKALQSGGSLFAHPIHLIIVALISLFFATGVINLIIDQWPCFIGVPNCD